MAQARREAKAGNEGLGAPARPRGAPQDALVVGGRLIDPERRRGRGAVSNPAARYEPTWREDADDGWGGDPDFDAAGLSELEGDAAEDGEEDLF
jgi:hypothetical protein